MPPKIAYVLPSYRHFDYAQATLRSLHLVSPFVLAIIVDDASPDWNDRWYRDSGGPVKVQRYKDNGGLTRSWNTGLEMGAPLADYLIAGNNDVLFTPGWWEPLCRALDNGYALAGPLTNAPGDGALHAAQHIRSVLPAYNVDDHPDAVTDTAARLAPYREQVRPGWINGFFMMAKTRDWLADGPRILPDRIEFNPSGRANPTPLMTGQEYWLQSRWEKQGRRSGIALGSFIFHYRSVSRGIRHACKGWCRRSTL